MTQFKPDIKPWTVRTTPGCGRPGHDEDHFDYKGKKRCRQCRLITNRRSAKRKHQQRRRQALEVYGGECAYCGAAEEVFLAIDHIDNNGGAHRKEIGSKRSSSAVYRWLEHNDYPGGFQVLCHNCNYAKHRKSLLTQGEDESMPQFKPGHKPWNARTTPGCGKPGHDEDHFSSSGKKSCRQCHLERSRRYDKESRRRLRHQVLEAYGGKCACCGVTEEMFLVIDHVEDNGNVHRKEIGSNSSDSTYRWLRQNGYPEGFQVLCHNCNHAKSRGGCPHQKDQ